MIREQSDVSEGDVYDCDEHHTSGTRIGRQWQLK
jgi:hypothetical protein